MDRQVPRTGSEEIELYIRTYYSLLRSTTDVSVRSLEEVHANMGSSLHLAARALTPDISALIYSSLRLPECIVDVDRVVLGQSLWAFIKRGIGDIETWQEVAAKARRRRSFFDGESTLACYIGSRSDIDDMVPVLTAYQIEWNKLHRLLQGEQVRKFLESPLDSEEGLAVLATGIGIEAEEVARLRTVWEADFWKTLQAIADHEKRFRLRLLAGSLMDYRQATQTWWEQVEAAVPSVMDRPVYFVSSNGHSIVNLISGYALRHEEDLVRYLEEPECRDLLVEWEDIKAREVPSSRENFLYYVLKKFVRSEAGKQARLDRAQAEIEAGVRRVHSQTGFDVEVQVFSLRDMIPDRIDPRLQVPGYEELARSEALIVNIDYPLGMAAYVILSHIATRFGEMRGVYIMGKAAILNGVLGDVMIPSVVHDEHSQNTYLFKNSFNAGDIRDELVYGTVLDNQKAVSVRGTFLQTPQYMDVFYREGYTDIEMEAGPYLSSVYELFRPKRYPTNEIVNLYGLPFDLGILHYASDTPLTRGLNLGAGSLSYFGMDPTYATSVAILRRIFNLEIEQLRS
ncbi:MAG: hypothetical protein P1P76_07890 [Anaerolineales bacterium]|nr:hypothetical protein [Anaerolineales bacterium]